MRKSLSFALALVLAAQLAAAPASAASVTDVCLDPGHGGSDPGAVRTVGAVTLREKELNLYIAQQLKTMLEADRYTVHLTRTTNEQTLGNSERANICNSVGARVVLSIHLNASTNENADYFQVFYGKKLKDEAFARTINANYHISHPDDPNIELIHNPVTNFANGTLLKSKAPAALSEGLFMSHSTEKTLLASGVYPASDRAFAVAANLYPGLKAWLESH